MLVSQFSSLFQLLIGALCKGSELINIAVNKPAKQSSSFIDDGFHAQAGLAVDGRAYDIFTDESCTHTDAVSKKGRAAWWEVDLQKLYIIDNIRILNRDGECGYRQHCAERLHDVSVDVYEDDHRLRKGKRCKTHRGMAGPGWLNMTCGSPVTGRYVRITKPQIGRSDVLSLCEVEIYGAQKMVSSEHFERISMTQVPNRGGRMTARSNLHCGTICARTTECIGFSLATENKGNIQCLHLKHLNKGGNSMGGNATSYFILLG